MSARTGWQECQDDLVAGLLGQHYGLKVSRSERLVRESVNVVRRLTTDQGVYTLKQLGRTAGRPWLGFQAAAVRLAADAGIPVQEPVAAADGSTTLFEDGRQWQLRPYVQGRAFAAGADADLDRVGDCLASLHALSTDGLSPVLSPAPDLEVWLSAEDDSEEKLERLHRLLTGVVPAAERDLALSAYRGACHRARAELMALGYPGWEPVLTHGEIAGSNLLFDPVDGTLSCVLDWDAVQLRPRAYDLARACLFLGRKARGSFDLDAGRAARVLRRATTARRLLPSETAALAPILELYFVPTPLYLSQLAEHGPEHLEWYVGWTVRGASRVRATLAPVLDLLRSPVTT
ncbi:phosphotransferase [Streptomyces sp. NPDC002588]|uniref:phosphotransferase n=1 Tax=Streptomyces sp. NPDC002588 TaxID=3154419 RepID=UPI003332FDB9